MESNNNNFTWNLTPVELYHLSKNSFNLGDEFLLSNGSVSKMCRELDVQLRGIININNSSLGGDKSLLIRYIHNNKQGLCLFIVDNQQEIYPIALIDDESGLSISNIDFRGGYNLIKEEFKPTNKEVLNLFYAAQRAFDELGYPQNNSEYQVLTTSVDNQITTKKFYTNDDAITYLQDMQIEAENPREKILKLELVELKKCFKFDKISKERINRSAAETLEYMKPKKPSLKM